MLLFDNNINKSDKVKKKVLEIFIMYFIWNGDDDEN